MIGIHQSPVPLTALIGRETEIGEITALFRDHRLLTLVGSGGVGKTRLAVQLSEALAPDFRHGACYVDVAPASDAAQAIQRVAEALKAPVRPGIAPLDSIIASLSSRHLLLVLDHCENPLCACSALAERLLGSCKALRILATSRQALGVTGEGVWRVSSLSVPGSVELPTDTLGLAMLLDRNTAVRLFVERAAEAQQTFHLTLHNAHAVMQICRQLDGIPLALELAAAAVKTLPVERIASHLSAHFRQLADGSEPTLTRQQTVEATIRWSLALLTDEDRAMLCSLSVFPGGCTLEAAEWMAAGIAIPEGEVPDILLRLVERSLIVYYPEGEQAHYRLPETVMQNGGEGLFPLDQIRSAQERCLDFFLGRIDEAGSLREANHALWMAHLEMEHANLRAALEWSITEPSCSAKGLRLAAAIWRFWHQGGYLSLGRRLLTALLARTAGSAADPARAEALNGAGALAFALGDIPAAKQLFEQGLAVAEELEADLLRADALESLGELAWREGDNSRARRLLLQSLSIRQAFSDAPRAATALHHLGLVAADEGDYTGARRSLAQSLSIYATEGEPSGLSAALAAFASLLARQQQKRRAAILFSAAQQLRESAGMARLPADAGEQTRLMETRAALGAGAFAEAWREGRSLTPIQAMALALQEI